MSARSSLEKKSLLRDNVDLLVSLADVYFRAGDTKNAILKFEQAQMLDPYLIKGRWSCPPGAAVVIIINLYVLMGVLCPVLVHLCRDGRVRLPDGSRGPPGGRGGSGRSTV